MDPKVKPPDRPTPGWVYWALFCCLALGSCIHQRQQWSRQYLDRDLSVVDALFRWDSSGFGRAVTDHLPDDDW